MRDRGEAEAVVHDLSTDGRGVVRVGGVVYFAPGALPGDRVKLALDAHTRPPSASVVRLLEPSPHRMAHPCPHATACMGSVWGTLAYSAQLECKRALTERTLRKQVSVPEVLPTSPSPHPWEYRNRASLHVWEQNGRLYAGFLTEPRARTGVPIRECRLCSPTVNRGIARLASVLNRLKPDECASVPRRIQIHETEAGAGMLAVFAGDCDPSLAAFWERALGSASPGGVRCASGTRAGVADTRRPIHASPEARPMLTHWLTQRVEVHPAAFCQANSGAAAAVFERLRELGKELKPKRIWDLYGGWGALGLASATEDQPVTVFESSPHAESAARSLVKQLGTGRPEFATGDLDKTFPRHAYGIEADDLVILDPPRSGAHERVLSLLGQSLIRHIAYLSCNPARLARDMAILASHGFGAVETRPCDFFPQTPRIEVLAILRRR